MSFLSRTRPAKAICPITSRTRSAIRSSFPSNDRSIEGHVSLAYLEDRLAINDLFVRYTTALDRGDVETIVDCFTPDGSLDSPAVGRHAGHAAIRAFAERFARFHERGAQLRHVVSNLTAEIDGDRARATCYLLNVL